MTHGWFITSNLSMKLNEIWITPNSFFVFAHTGSQDTHRVSCKRKALLLLGCC